jgi:hypothetical protein
MPVLPLPPVALLHACLEAFRIVIAGLDPAIHDAFQPEQI